MKVIEEFYVCDYCGERKEEASEMMYVDDSGWWNVTYDMCSDWCLARHKDRLVEDMGSEEARIHIEEHVVKVGEK